ncbi:MAG: cytochrome c oxidase assembly protein subunit Cox15 [Saliniramus fredricksonii]|uniref:Heme A synthase n=1 Tax=Saliniramus fredricksonii TaxID=1653334 RepID=A0A0N8KDZ8_9HYPH|nr:MAG: cytochrome c oxidase assembly protein subunit Cox15 [Saliniramus fredricksonii]SCC80871.1 cytochrome c oxidase assembly protein subunit 15 [Saliniramus fredricksonii]
MRDRGFFPGPAFVQGPAFLPDRAVRAWIWTLVGFVLAMVTVGGATRLTGSGLSITEWAPVTGAIPPLSEAAWLAEFERYRQIDQYRLLNQGMSLAEFQVIYWWEWGHRQLGRALGFVFFLPLIWFWLRSRITTGFALTLIAIGALGGMQAFVGWIMVASGLEEGMIAVAPIKLMTHLMLASIILVALTWIATGLRSGRVEPTPRAVALGAYGLVGVILFQTALGALVAGSRAGWTYNTWPLMDGVFIPSMAVLFPLSPWYANIFDTVATIQFNHRMVAYLLVGYALWHAWRVGRLAPGTVHLRHARIMAGLVLAQVVLGIVTLLLAVPLWAGLAHQVFAMLLLAMAVVHARIARDAAPARRRVDTGQPLPVGGAQISP